MMKKLPRQVNNIKVKIHYNKPNMTDIKLKNLIKIRILIKMKFITQNI